MYQLMGIKIQHLLLKSIYLALKQLHIFSAMNKYCRNYLTQLFLIFSEIALVAGSLHLAY